MADSPERRADGARQQSVAPAAAVPSDAPTRPPASEPAHPDRQAAPATGSPAAAPPTTAARRTTWQRWRRWLLLAGTVLILAIGLKFLIPWLHTTLNTVSTDDAYVNGHVTFVAPRVSGQVVEVLVDDNNRVKKDQPLVRLDTKPYEVQVAIKNAAVDAAQANLKAAIAQAYGLVGQTRSNRFKLDHAIEEVDNQIANLRANVATLDNRKASLKLAQQNLARGIKLAPGGGISKEDLDARKQQVRVAEANVEQALQTVYATRVSLGLPEKPAEGDDLTQVPPNLDQDYATVRQALAETMYSAAQLGYFPTSWNATPKQAIRDFYKQDAKGDLDTIYERLVHESPGVKQAETKLLEANRDLDEAKLNLSYCEIKSEIDGVVTSRNVNPGNNVSVGQSLMAVRSLTEIWIDANFKETQLADLRIGQRVRCEVDMYGSRREFEGRISGFTMGTGQTLALLPPQNATGNFVKIVQRLPVRIELMHYDPDKDPLFVGLSVEPFVYYKEKPTGPHAGDYLQPLTPLPQHPAEPRP